MYAQQCLLRLSNFQYSDSFEFIINKQQPGVKGRSDPPLSCSLQSLSSMDALLIPSIIKP